MNSPISRLKDSLAQMGSLPEELKNEKQETCTPRGAAKNNLDISSKSVTLGGIHSYIIHHSRFGT